MGSILNMGHPREDGWNMLATGVRRELRAGDRDWGGGRGWSGSV